MDDEMRFAVDHPDEVRAAAAAIRAETWPNGQPFAPGDWATMLARRALYAAHRNTAERGK